MADKKMIDRANQKRTDEKRQVNKVDAMTPYSPTRPQCSHQVKFIETVHKHVKLFSRYIGCVLKLIKYRKVYVTVIEGEKSLSSLAYSPMEMQTCCLVMPVPSVKAEGARALSVSKVMTSLLARAPGFLNLSEIIDLAMSPGSRPKRGLGRMVKRIDNTAKATMAEIKSLKTLKACPCSLVLM